MSQDKNKELKIFELTNKDTGERHLSVSTNAQNACKQAGWPIGDCYVMEQQPRWKGGKHGDSTMLVKIPCLVCPFQYAECRKPLAEDCPTRPKAPELQEWVKQAAEAHLCNYVGQDLPKTDYHLGQKWLPMEQAIEELGDHHRP